MNINVCELLLIFFVSLSITNCSTSNSSSKNKPLEKVISGCVKGSCINGTGKFQRLYKNGNFVHETNEGSFNNGKLRVGKKTFYTQQGDIDNIESGTYKQNKRHGKIIYTRYYRGEVTYISTSHYVNGELEGLSKSRSYDRGKLSTADIANYRNGKKHGTYIFTFHDIEGAHTRIEKYVDGRLIQ